MDVVGQRGGGGGGAALLVGLGRRQLKQCKTSEQTSISCLHRIEHKTLMSVP